jgi:hypothetical protein
MGLLERLKRRPKSFSEEDFQEWLLNQKLDDLFDFLSYKTLEQKKPIKMVIQFLDMKYTITCEHTDELLKEMEKEKELKTE